MKNPRQRRAGGGFENLFVASPLGRADAYADYAYNDYDRSGQKAGVHDCIELKK